MVPVLLLARVLRLVAPAAVVPADEHYPPLITELFRTTAAADDDAAYTCAYAAALAHLPPQPPAAAAAAASDDDTPAGDTANGTLVIFYEGRTGNCTDTGGRSDVLYTLSSDLGRSWKAPQLLYSAANDSRFPHKTLGNPTPIVDAASGRLSVLFSNNSTFVLLSHSTDRGETFTRPTDISTDVKETVGARN